VEKRLIILESVILCVLLVIGIKVNKLGELKVFRFASAEEVEQMSDEDLVYIGLNDYESADFFPDGEYEQVDLFGVELEDERSESITMYRFGMEDNLNQIDVKQGIPEELFHKMVEEDIQKRYEYATDKEPDEDTGDVLISKDTIYCGENTFYKEYSIRYTQRRYMYMNNELVVRDLLRGDRVLYWKQYIEKNDTNKCERYLVGEIDAEYVKDFFDLDYYNWDGIVYHEVTEDDMKYTYTMYRVKFGYGDYGENNYVGLTKYENYVDKMTRRLDVKMTKIRKVEIPNTVWDKPEPQ